MYQLAAPASFEIVIKKSRFIGMLFAVGSRAEAHLLLAEQRRQHPGACHVCWALVCDGDSGLDDDGEAWVMPPPKVTVIRNTGRNAGHAWDTQSLGSKQHVLAPAAPEPRAAAAGEPVRPSGARASVARVDGAQAREKVAEGSRDARKRDARAVEARRPDAIPADASAANLGPSASAVSIPRTSSSAYVWIGASVMLLGLAILLWQLWPAPAPLEANPAPQALPPSRPAYNPPPADTLLAAPDFDLLLDNDAPALLDDLAFYTWLHTTEALGPDTPDSDTPDASTQARNAQD